MNPKTPKQRLTKEEINALPLEYYSGPIHIIESVRDVSRACIELQSESVLGFDTETRPAFKKGQYFSPSLLQIASFRAVYLFRINKYGLPSSLKFLLENYKIIKTGVAIDRDIKDMRKLSDFDPSNFVDLGKVAREKELQHHGLRGLAALLLKFRISKSSKTSNWDADTLTEKQVKYAATDAWVSRKIYCNLFHFYG